MHFLWNIHDRISKYCGGGSVANQQSDDTHVITGRVVDASTNEPVIGANIVVKGTTNGTATGADGRFTLQVGKKPRSTFHSSAIKPSRSMSAAPRNFS